jgi:hypothetical protein
MPLPTLIYEITVGTLMRGSVDKALQNFAHFENTAKLGRVAGMSKRKRAGEGQNANGRDRPEV